MMCWATPLSAGSRLSPRSIGSTAEIGSRGAAPTPAVSPEESAPPPGVQHLRQQVFHLLVRHGAPLHLAAGESDDPPAQAVSILVIVEHQHAVLAQVASQHAEHGAPKVRLGVGKETECRDQVELPLAERIFRRQVRLEQLGLGRRRRSVAGVGPR